MTVSYTKAPLRLTSPAPDHPEPCATPCGWTPAAFAKALLDWFALHGRKDLPWQSEPSPYRVWVSEIMLQQTQVAVVIPYFERFIARFPSPCKLAEADLDSVLRLWAGLGYYARARNLHRAAGIIRDRHGAQLPSDLNELMALPGIGRSTAGAIVSLAWGRPAAILDGNVRRVLTRCFAISGWPGQTQVAARLWALAETLIQAIAEPQSGLDRPLASAYNQALMDLGATLCSRTRPDCARCPLRAGCLARLGGSVALYPQAKPGRALPRRQATWLVLRDPDGRVLLLRQPASGLWGGLWVLPTIPPGEDACLWCQNHLGQQVRPVEKLSPRQHSFSHFALDIFPEVLEVLTLGSRIADEDNAIWAAPQAALTMALPAPVKRLLDDWMAATRA